MWLARREGVRAAQAIAEAVSQRRAPHAELTDGMLVAAGGVLLFVPGLVTDVAGLLLLLPPVRRVVRNRLVRAAEAAGPRAPHRPHPLGRHDRRRRRRPAPAPTSG